MFLDNKYTKLYYKIIDNAKNNIKEANDGNQTHHIIPKCMGGTNNPDNLVVLSYKQHRVVHRLLINMTEGQDRIKMSYAYSWFGKSAGNYKRGKDNNFAQPEMIELVRERMINNNPMKNPKQRERMSKTNWRNNSCVIDGIEYVSQSAAARALGISNYELRRDYLNLYQLQTAAED